jgi:hypothetical protein
MATCARILGGCLLAGLPLWAQSLLVRLTNDHLRVSAPGLRFVAGKPLERLHDGAPVAFAFQLSLSIDAHATILLRDIQRFVMSYDLWEEKFSILKLGHPRSSVSHLSAEGAEAWCLEALALPASGLASEKPFWMKLEGRMEDAREPAGLENEGSVSLSRLIELFSRRTRTEQTRWAAAAGPLRLAGLKKSSVRAPGAQ